MLRRRLTKKITDTHDDQQELDEIFTSLNSLLELHSNLYDLQKQTLDPVIKKAYTDTKNEIVQKVRTLYARNISVVDLVKRYGALLVKSQILQAQELVSKKENEQGEIQLTDLVSEDQIIADRLAPIKQQGVELGYFSGKISSENLLKSKRLKEIATVLARRETERQNENEFLPIKESLDQDTEQVIEKGEELKESRLDEEEEMKIEEEPMTVAQMRAIMEELKEKLKVAESQKQQYVKEYNEKFEPVMKEVGKLTKSLIIKPSFVNKYEKKLEQLEQTYKDIPEDQRLEGEQAEKTKQFLVEIEQVSKIIKKRKKELGEVQEAKEEKEEEAKTLQKDVEKIQGEIQNLLEGQYHFTVKSANIIESYRESRRKELVDIKIDTFTKGYDKRLTKNLKKYMDIYTPLVSQFRTDFIKDLKKEILKIGEERFADGLAQSLEDYKNPDPVGEKSDADIEDEDELPPLSEDILKKFDNKEVQDIIKELEDIFQKESAFAQIEEDLRQGNIHTTKKLQDQLKKKQPKDIVYELATKIKLLPYNKETRTKYVGVYGAGLVDAVNGVQYDEEFQTRLNALQGKDKDVLSQVSKMMEQKQRA